MKLTKDKQLKILSALILLSFILGCLFGGYVTYIIVQKGLENIMTNIQIHNVEIGFNETYMMDRLEHMVNNSLVKR